MTHSVSRGAAAAGGDRVTPTPQPPDPEPPTEPPEQLPYPSPDPPPTDPTPPPIPEWPEPRGLRLAEKLRRPSTEAKLLSCRTVSARLRQMTGTRMGRCMATKTPPSVRPYSR